MQNRPQELIILCGGSGTRLRPVLVETPKILAPVGDKTFLDYLLHYVQSIGIDRFLFCTGHLGHMIKDYIQANHSELQALFIQEEEPLGTGGAIQNALPYCSENHVLVTNGDTLHICTLNRLWETHLDAEAVCTMQSAYVDDVTRYGTVSWNDHNQVISFHEKGQKGAGWINAGTYLLDKEKFLKRKLPVHFSFENEFLPDLVSEKSLWITRQTGYFIDIGIPEDLHRSKTEIPAHVK